MKVVELLICQRHTPFTSVDTPFHSRRQMLDAVNIFLELLSLTAGKKLFQSSYVSHMKGKNILYPPFACH